MLSTGPGKWMSWHTQQGNTRTATTGAMHTSCNLVTDIAGRRVSSMATVALMSWTCRVRDVKKTSHSLNWSAYCIKIMLLQLIQRRRSWMHEAYFTIISLAVGQSYRTLERVMLAAWEWRFAGSFMPLDVLYRLQKTHRHYTKEWKNTVRVSRVFCA